MADQYQAFSEEFLAASKKLLSSGLSESAKENEDEVLRTERVQKNLLFLKSLFTRLDDSQQTYAEFKTERDRFLKHLDDRYGISGDPGAPKEGFQPDPAKVEEMIMNLANQRPEDLRRVAPNAMARVESKIKDYANPKHENGVYADAKSVGLEFSDQQFKDLALSLALAKTFNEEFPRKRGPGFLDGLKKSAKSINAALKDPNKKLGMSAAKFAIMAVGTGGASVAVGSAFLGISVMSHPKIQEAMGKAVDHFEDYLADKGIDTQPVKNVAAAIGNKFKGLLPKRDNDQPMSFGAKVALGVAGAAAATAAVAYGTDASMFDFKMPNEFDHTRATGPAQDLMETGGSGAAQSGASTSDAKATDTVKPETTKAPTGPSPDDGKVIITSDGFDRTNGNISELLSGAGDADLDAENQKALDGALDGIANIDSKGPAAPEAPVTPGAGGADGVAPDVAEGMTKLSLPEGGNIWRSVAEHIQQTTGMKPQTADIVRMTNQVLVENGIKDATKLQVGFTFNVPTDPEQFLHGDKIDRDAMDNILLASGVEPEPAASAPGAPQVATKPEAPSAKPTAPEAKPAEAALAGAAQAISALGGSGAEGHAERVASMLAQTSGSDQFKEYAEKLANAQKSGPSGLSEGP